MALKTFVKISEVNNLSDARYCAGMGVNQLGFNIVPGHPHFVDPEKFKEIAGWVAGVQFVGELGDQSIENAMEIIGNYEFDYLQTNRIDLLEEFNRFPIPIILDVNTDNHTDASAIEKVFDYGHELVDYFLVHTIKEEKNQQFLSDLTNLSASYEIVLGSWVDSHNVDNLLSGGSFKGIALKGGDEIKPGYKDFDELAGILELIETEEEI